MKKTRIIALVLLAALLISACGSKNPETTSASTIESTEETKDETGASVSESEDATSSEDTSEETDSVSESVESIEEAYEEDGFTPLTEIEMRYFTEFCQKAENYGFLLSTYSDILDVDLDQVFYNGAGYDYTPTEEDYERYLELSGDEEVYCSLAVVSEDYINNLLARRTGYGYGYMRKWLYNWVCDYKNGIYYRLVGDTNYVPYKVVNGFYKDDLYILHLKNDSFARFDMDNSFHIPLREVALQKVGKDFRFLSCRNLIDEGAITDYCYNLVLPYFGESNIMVYEPDKPGDDITISIVSDGEIKANLTWGNYDNLLVDYTFDHIVDMGFSDYNNDGFVDIAMVVDYITESNEDYYQLRVYSGDLYGYFIREEEKALDCYACVSENTSTKDIRTPVMFDLLSSSYKDVDYEWISSYIHAIEPIDDDFMENRYQFMYLDNDKVPEILREGSCEAEGHRIFSTYQGNVSEINTNRLYFTYLEGEGLLNNCDGNSGYNHDTVFRLKDGKFEIAFDGTYELDYSQIVDSYDEDTAKFDYYIDGNPVSKEEYKTRLNNLYPEYSARSLDYYCKSLTKAELFRLLTHDVVKIFD